MLDRVNAVNDSSYHLATKKHTVSTVSHALIDTFYHFRHVFAAVGVLIVMVLMICGPGACRHPLFYVLGWFIYIPLGVFACMPLIDRICVAVDRMEEAERRG
ncbi:hypothetical protein PG2048B_0741 [Bifidobacterium pseudolongum subsp. globosum]|uniref:hypothetical protein n=1 Tax=Bifidobacterium pseudolongum TaxID=1694 RepID=UPI0010211BB7|nr:hypothetical protein [Bifidobacterium pseudolongum]RYQ24439.1 hypothetical protein PG2048B_0741 [Bifidobacterium pseudolongum subsp. globosum]